ncbi:Cwf15/Cwc15 cell cycle control protein [Gigaspora margarita]|uniref:Cwf15/Cwc15 cell cycle control protein n=1 Tax=Gigaspora margarita TaxID=4874 RepID=A0A8H4ESD3_GIGMA|nr:Cwf15/Cwc15 cell cycle control protein [Gigaspora margarita]KAF0545765.1 Cwf15/Cwc15 cell cycle control protein [Gigaspora margarita]
MTTAARPTLTYYDSKAPTLQYSSRDLAAHTKLKFRQTGQLTKEELENIDLKEELLKAEREHFEKIQVFSDEEEVEDDTAALLLELEKIKKERAEKQERIELEKIESAKRGLSHFYFLNTTIYITVVSVSKKD